jgi:seryl-tRNA(Sec) selenium transferase
MKVGKEEIIGVLAAVEAWKKYDLAMHAEWSKRAKRISQLVETVPGVTSELQVSAGGGYPTLTVTWDEAAFKMDVQACARLLRNGSPPIDVLTKVNRSHVAAVELGQRYIPFEGPTRARSAAHRNVNLASRRRTHRGPAPR